MLRGSLLGVICGSLLCSAAFAQSVRTSYRPGIDFSKYHTYKWISVTPAAQSDPALDAQVMQSIDSQLVAKGLTKKDDTADLDIDFQIAITHAEEWRSYEDWTLVGPAARLPQHKKVTIDVGTLVVDMYDPTARQLVWTGRANKSLDLKGSEGDRRKALDAAAKKLLKTFPPPSGEQRQNPPF